MNKILWEFRKLCAWGNKEELQDLSLKDWKKLGFFESYGW